MTNGEVGLWFEIAKWFETKAGILNLVLALWIVWAEIRCFFATKHAQKVNSRMADLMIEDVGAKKDLVFAIDKVLTASKA
jgi:ABC-type nickel/cobalt efflux system permease component RcnA